MTTDNEWLFPALEDTLLGTAADLALGRRSCEEVLSACLWTLLHGLVFARMMPWLAKMLPYGPMVIASAVFGAALAIEVPLRTRKLV